MIQHVHIYICDAHLSNQSSYIQLIHKFQLNHTISIISMYILRVLYIYKHDTCEAELNAGQTVYSLASTECLRRNDSVSRGQRSSQ